MNRNIFRHTLICILLLMCLCAHSRQYIFRGLSATEGMQSLAASALYKDSLGYVWIGTASSLERFDGVCLKHYPVYGTNEKLKWVNVIAEMPGNEIWMGNDMGLWRVNNVQEKLEAVATDQIKSGVRALLYDGTGTLYIGSKTGLFLYKEGRIERIMIDSNISSSANSVMGLNIDQNGILWILTENGLYSMCLSNRKINAYPYIPTDKSMCTYKNMTRVDTKLYLGTMEQGIIRFDIRSGKFSSYVDVGSNVISSLSGNGKDILYVSTDGNGVHFISTTKNEIIRSFRHEPGGEGGIRSNSVYSLLVDRDGLIWVGFYQMGLDYTLSQSELFSTYNFPPFFDSKDLTVRTISIISPHEKLIGSRDGLFYIDERNQRFKSFRMPQLRSNLIISMHAFQRKHYIGTYGGGMFVFDPADASIHDFEPTVSMPFQRGKVFCIQSDTQENLWICTSQGLYCYKDGRQVAYYTSANSKLPEGNVYSIFFDSTRKGWICTENGMCIWDPSSGTLKTDVFPEGFIAKEKIRGVYEDSRHELYFLPDRGAIFVSDLTMNRFRRFSSGTLLEGKDAMFMIEDRDNWLWIGTNNGLYRYDKKETIIPYNFADGILNPIFTSCPPVIDTNGTIWFGNSKGLLYLNAGILNQKERYHYPICFTDLCINGKQTVYPVYNATTKNYEVVLEAAQRNLTLFFSAFTYTDPAYMSYEYKLEGRDESWQTQTGKSEITYYDLPSGVHIFKVRHVGSPDTEVTLTISVASLFNATTWMVILFVVIVLALAAWFYYRRIQKNPAETLIPEKIKAPEEKYKNSNMTPEECKRLTDKLEAAMRTEKPYTNPELKITDLALLLQVSSYTLSYLFNQHLNRNYYDYINDYRIAEFKHLTEKGEHSKYSLNALAELCGFGSRATFFRNFKKATGITPSEYIQQMDKTGK